MSNVKRGDVVILALGGKDYNALVHQVVATEDSHMGKNGEPALHLSYLPDEPLVNGKPKIRPLGYIPESLMIYDVVHASHEFTADYMQQHGLRKLPEHDLHRVVAEAEISNRRGAGEWTLASVLRCDGTAIIAGLKFNPEHFEELTGSAETETQEIPDAQS